MEENFNEYLAFFRKQPLKEKQSIIHDQLEMLADFTYDLRKEMISPDEQIFNRKRIDLKSGNYTEDEYAEALIILINSIQDSLCDYINGLSDFVDKIEDIRQSK